MNEGDGSNIDTDPALIPLQSAAAASQAALFPRIAVPPPGALHSIDGMVGPDIVFNTSAAVNGVSITKSSAANSTTFGISGVGELAAVKCTVDNVPPAVTDDSASGYTKFSQWIDRSGAPDFYVCVDDTPGAAIWLKLN